MLISLAIGLKLLSMTLKSTVQKITNRFRGAYGKV
jgi:hypothetical protein